MHLKETHPLLLKQLHVIGQKANARALEIEKNRNIPEDLMAEIVDTGVLRLWVAQKYGGHEASVRALMEAVETLAYYESSTAWVCTVTGTAALNSGFLSPTWAQEIYGDPKAVTGGLVAPMGQAIREKEGFRISGRWTWGSGTPHCTWILGGAKMMGEDIRRFLVERRMMYPIVYMPRDEVQLFDTWRSSGLKGTASGEYEVQGSFVPDGRWVTMPIHSAVIESPLYRFSSMGALAATVAATALGMARRALDEILELGPNKTPAYSRKLLAESPVIQSNIAQAEAGFQAARAFLYQTVEKAWEEAHQGEVGLERKRLLRVAATHAAIESAQVVDTAYRAGGGSSIWEGVPLQRIFRDIHVLTQHALVNPKTLETSGRLLFGMKADTMLL